MTNSIPEISGVEVLFVIGANPTEAHPIIGLEMKKALRKGATLIVADPRKTWLAQHAHIHLPLRPGTDNLLLNAMMHVILAEGLENREFVATRTEGFDALKALAGEITPEHAAEACGVNADDIRQAARLYAKAGRGAIFYTLGITEHICGTDNVRTLANLAMLTGQIGRPSTGVNPMRGQNNVQGGCDMGALPEIFPGYQKVADPAVIAKFEAAWGVKLPATPGLKMPDMFDAAIAGKLKGMFIMGEDPVMSEPHQSHIVRALNALDFLVVQEIFMSETAKLAGVILPGATFAEKDGTFTNTERRVQRVRKAIEPLAGCKPDWLILCELSTRMGCPMPYRSPEEIWNEVASLVPAYAGINYARIEHVGLQWPCPTPDHPGTQSLHAGKFTRGLGQFFAARFRPPAEQPDADYPLLLTTGRTLFHYNVGTMTRRSKGITTKSDECFVEINPYDASRLGFAEGAMVRIETRRGSIQAKAAVSDRVPRGIIWMPFHFAEASANKLTNSASDDVTKTGEYKVAAARVART
jgi:formate dehydrogenase major subunit/formate dehydrogenase alpha subunit